MHILHTDQRNNKQTKDIQDTQPMDQVCEHLCDAMSVHWLVGDEQSCCALRNLVTYALHTW